MKKLLVFGLALFVIAAFAIAMTPEAKAVTDACIVYHSEGQDVIDISGMPDDAKFAADAAYYGCAGPQGAIRQCYLAGYGATIWFHDSYWDNCFP